MAKWGVLAVLAAAQFLMVLDQAVMNVAISQLVEDFDTTVTTIQAVIALYALVMAALMLTGGKLGDIWGGGARSRSGSCIYGVGSALTAASWSVPSADARLVDPRGDRRGARAAGAGRPRRRQLPRAATGRSPTACSAASPAPGSPSARSSAAGRPPSFSWRVVFVGEVVVAIGILLGTRLIREPEREQGARRGSTGSAACSPRSAWP